MKQKISIANPLPLVMAHYVDELCDTMDRVEISYDLYPAWGVEGKAGACGRAQMLLNALANPVRGRFHSNAVFVAWPSLGLLDGRLWTSHHGRHFVVLHDPVPIRRQVGFGKLSQRIARRAGKSAPTVVTHSRDAYGIARELFPEHRHLHLPHPIATNQQLGDAKRGQRIVLVAGQFKPERNLDLLRELGPRLHEIGAVGKICGRGWPEIPGWNVDSRFLGESELDKALSAASAVIIPYSRYYQSGIAIRALELGTMSVSPENSFARDVLGACGVIGPTQGVDDWLSAIRRICEDQSIAKSVFEAYRCKVDAEWIVIRDLECRHGTE